MILGTLCQAVAEVAASPTPCKNEKNKSTNEPELKEEEEEETTAVILCCTGRSEAFRGAV